MCHNAAAFSIVCQGAFLEVDGLLYKARAVFLRVEKGVGGRGKGKEAGG